MAEKALALRLADQMLHYWDERGPDAEEVAAELRLLHAVDKQRDELLVALKASVDSFCSYRCPSVWKTADGRPHSEQCKANHAAIAKAEVA